MILILMVDGARAVISFCIRSAIPGYMVVGNNLQQLEVSEEKAMAREENYQKQLHELMVRLKAAETEAENSEMNIQRLKIKKISDDVDGTFKQMESGVVVV